MSAAVSAAKSAMRNGPSGVAERPTPRLSKVVSAVAVAQAGDLVDPAGALVGEAGDEEDVVALAVLLDPEVDAVRIDDRHGPSLERRPPMRPREDSRSSAAPIRSAWSSR